MENQNQYAACPKCGKSEAKKVGYTWWGGALGPSMLTHVKCQSCGAEYNGKTGESNQTKIIIYFAVIFIITFVLFFVLSMLNG